MFGEMICFALYNFGKMTFGQMMFRENDVGLNDVS